MPVNEFLVFILFVIGFALTPGPNMMLYLAYTFEYGRKAGWVTAAGIVSAFVVHIAAIVLGLTAVLFTMPDALDLLRYCGIAYLLYLAVKNLEPVQWKKNVQATEHEGLFHFYGKGFTGNLLNPGSLFLYFSLLPQFIHPERGHVLMQNLVLGGLQMLFSFITNCTIIYFAGFAGRLFLQNEKYQRRVRVIMSILIAAFALQLLFFKTRS